MRARIKPDLKTLVLHPDLGRSESRRSPDLALEEAVSLTEALPELEVVASFVVPVNAPKAGTLFGTGKVNEIKVLCADLEAGLVIIDGPVSPIQQRNLEKFWKVKILDRTGLILEIFGDRAQTREGVLQVDLAHLIYQKSRLVRSWTHLERQRGALGFVGGPGETQIEADRRAIAEQITRIRRQLSKVVKTRELHRAARKKVPFPIVALVGYTNAGKSSLFNRLTGADVVAKDMLFATLDPTMRRVALPSGREVILTDTVGFISDLPKQLVAAFRATLEEVLDADLVVHVRDISHPETEVQAEDVLDILETLGLGEAVQGSMIEVHNKLDLLSPDQAKAVLNAADRDPQKIALSALSGQGMDALCEAIDVSLAEPTTQETVDLGFAEGRMRSWLFEHDLVQSEHQDETGYHLSVAWTTKQRNQFQDFRSGH
ncbi:GTPase HflX [Halovulum sp. GXIMD14793]